MVPFLTGAPLLHLYQVTLSVHEGDTPLPSRGTFDWHYLQCVIRAFGTQDYRNYPDIRYPVHPFKTADDFDDEWDDEYFDDHPEVEPPYPSYRFDRFLAKQGENLRELKRNEEVARWASGI